MNRTANLCDRGLRLDYVNYVGHFDLVILFSFHGNLENYSKFYYGSAGILIRIFARFYFVFMEWRVGRVLVSFSGSCEDSQQFSICDLLILLLLLQDVFTVQEISTKLFLNISSSIRHPTSLSNLPSSKNNK